MLENLFKSTLSQIDTSKVEIFGYKALIEQCVSLPVSYGVTELV